jgi:sugar-phosphatase
MVSPATVVGDFTGILFDNEGTLIDASEATRHCWFTFASWYHLPVEEVLALVPGRPARDVIQHFAAQLPVTPDEALRRYLEFAATSQVGIRPIPGARSLVAQLPADRWVVVTSGTRDFAVKRITAADLPEPAHLITADDVSAGKPDPQPYLAAAQKIGANPADCLAIDDSPAGIESASRAGCSTLALLTTHRRSQLSTADAYAETLSQLRISVHNHQLHVTLHPTESSSTGPSDQ